MDQVSNRSGVGSDDITDETTSVADTGGSTDEENNSDFQGVCLVAPQAPLPYYKLRLDEFKRLFKEVPDSERLIVDYPCALQRDILLQGRLYLSENWVCFYSNVFRGTKIMLILGDVKSMTREKTARLIPNAIQICTDAEKFFFTSFAAREKSYQSIFRMWQNTLMDNSLTSSEFWHMVKQHYGNDLGLSHEEMENLQMSSESNMQSSLTPKLGGDDNQGKMERPPSLHITAPEQVPVETSTPQEEELPSPFGSLSPGNGTNFLRTPSMRHSRVPALDRFAPERISKHSNQSLDLNANENNGSEQSGSESVEEVEDRVDASHQASGRLYLNKVFHVSANKMFELLFTESSFIRRFMNVRKMTNCSFTGWQKDASGHMKRNLNYTITITNPLVGKFSTATENQTLYKESRDGHYYLVDSEVYTHDVPYHDYFYTQNRYYIISNSKRKCRLRVYTDVKYNKQPWGLVKSFITKNSWSGIEEYFKQLEAELLEEEAELNQGGGDTGKMGGLRRRRRTFSRTMPDHVKPIKPYGQDSELHRDAGLDHMEMKGPYRWNITTIVAAMSVILLFLTLLNLGLFVKLWAMEDVAHRMYLSTKHRLRERSEASFAQEYSPKPIPGLRNREEMQLLKTVLQDSIKLLEQLHLEDSLTQVFKVLIQFFSSQLRKSLMVLQQNFALTNQTGATQ